MNAFLFLKKITLLSSHQIIEKIISGLVFLSNNTDFYLAQIDNSSEMKKVFLKLGTFLEDDITLITKLYLDYKEKDKEFFCEVFYV